MGAGSFLASVARHSLRPARQHSKAAAAAEVYDIALIDHERPTSTHANHAQLAGEQPAGTALPLLNSFHVDLAERLQQLQLQGTGSAHLNWLLDALASTLSTHSSLQLALTASASASASASAAGVASAAKHRADEVLSMLDVCTALKQVADDLHHQFRCLHHALQSVEHVLNSGKPLSSRRLRPAARRLSACLTNTVLCVSAGNPYQPLAEARSSLLLAAKRELQSVATPDLAATLLSQAVDGAMLTSLLVLASAVSSLAPPSPRKSSGTITSACKMVVKYLGAKNVCSPWAAALRQLHRDLRQEDMQGAAGGAFFQEVQGLHCAAAKLHTTITAPEVYPIELAGVKQSVATLRKSLLEADACASMFRVQMASFFQALIALRLALLHR